MSEIIERVARAQCASAGHLLEEFEGEELQAALDLARVAIEAMREPTLEMLDDGHRAAQKTRVSGVSGMTLDAQVNAQCARENAAWRAMIDAALA